MGCPYKHKLLQHVQVLQVGNRPNRVEQQLSVVYTCMTAEIQEESNFKHFAQPLFCLNSLVSVSGEWLSKSREGRERGQSLRRCKEKGLL